MSRRPRFRFFGGKGGVGKTTLAAAWALARAADGQRVLLLSTDPAHSLSDALGEPLAGEPRKVALPTGGCLWAAEPVAGDAWQRWLTTRRRELVLLAERGSFLDREQANELLDLPVPGVDELIGLGEITRLASQVDASLVVVDTAPTAHTLRLLAQPETLGRFGSFLEALAEKHRVVAERLVGALEEDAAERAAHEVVAEAVRLGELLRHPDRVRFAWVLLAEELSLEESRDALDVLDSTGVRVDLLLVNRVRFPPEGPCELCHARRGDQARVLARLPDLWPDLLIRQVPELEEEPTGPPALERLAVWVRTERAPGVAPATEPEAVGPPPVGRPPQNRASSEHMLDRIAPPETSLLFVGGKGGVGKSTVAATLALLVARQRPHLDVLLLSTDPAHSLADVLRLELGDDPRPVSLPNHAGSLTARELAAETAYANHRRRLRSHLVSLLRAGDRSSGAELSLDRAVLERLFEAVPPGLDELEAMAALTGAGTAETPNGPDLVVVDTAPTGHTLNLLELPDVALDWVHTLMSWLLDSRKALGLGALAEDLLALAQRLKRFRKVLRDTSRTRFLPVTRAAELPRRETRRLLEALDGLGIAAPVVAVNAILPETTIACARCRRQRRRQAAEMDALGTDRAILEIPAVFPPPRGVAALLSWGESFTFGGSEP